MSNLKKQAVSEFLLKRKELDIIVNDLNTVGMRLLNKVKEIKDKYRRDYERLKPGIAEAEKESSINIEVITPLMDKLNAYTTILEEKQKGIISYKNTLCKNDSDYNTRIVKLFTLGGGKANDLLINVMNDNNDVDGLKMLIDNVDDIGMLDKILKMIAILEAPSQAIKEAQKMIKSLRINMPGLIRHDTDVEGIKKELNDTLESFKPVILEFIDKEEQGEWYIDYEEIQRVKKELEDKKWKDNSDEFHKGVDELKEFYEAKEKAKELEIK